MNNIIYVITYYGTGMSPMTKRFTSYPLALAEWNRMKDDPWQGAHTFEKIELLDRK